MIINRSGFRLKWWSSKIISLFLLNIIYIIAIIVIYKILSIIFYVHLIIKYGVHIQKFIILIYITVQ